MALCIQSVGVRPGLACECMQSNPDRAIKEFSAIVDGVVFIRELSDASSDPFAGKIAVMRVEKAWKGDPEQTVSLLYDGDEAACGAVPPLGQKLRVGAVAARGQQYSFGLCSTLPIDDPAFEAAFHAYIRDTRAATLDFEDQHAYGQLALAHYFRRNREYDRALRILANAMAHEPENAELMLEAAVAEAALNGANAARAMLEAARSTAGSSARMPGKFARAQFEALGQFDPEWKDWTDLGNVGPCNCQSKALEGAWFDRSRLLECDFAGADLRGASFLGTDLVRADLTLAQVTGATFDCKTSFQPNFDPLARGMIRIENGCRD
jgi:hypothetical protein